VLGPLVLGLPLWTGPNATRSQATAGSIDLRGLGLYRTVEGQPASAKISPPTSQISHTLAPPVRTPISGRKLGGGRRDAKSIGTNRIQAGRSRPAQSIVSICSVLELSRYGARHVGRFVSADLDNSGLSVLTMGKVSADQECGHWCGRSCGRPRAVQRRQASDEPSTACVAEMLPPTTAAARRSVTSITCA